MPPEEEAEGAREEVRRAAVRPPPPPSPPARGCPQPPALPPRRFCTAISLTAPPRDGTGLCPHRYGSPSPGARSPLLRPRGCGEGRAGGRGNPPRRSPPPARLPVAPVPASPSLAHHPGLATGPAGAGRGMQQPAPAGVGTGDGWGVGGRKSQKGSAAWDYCNGKRLLRLGEMDMETPPTPTAPPSSCGLAWGGARR